MVLDETESAVDVIIFFDGAESGAPTLLTLVKPAAILDLGSGFTSAAFRFYAKNSRSPMHGSFR